MIMSQSGVFYDRLKENLEKCYKIYDTTEYLNNDNDNVRLRSLTNLCDGFVNEEYIQEEYTDENGDNKAIYRKVITTKDDTPVAVVMLTNYLSYKHAFNTESKLTGKKNWQQKWKVENKDSSIKSKYVELNKAPDYELNILCVQNPNPSKVENNRQGFGAILMLMSLLYLQKTTDITKDAKLVIHLTRNLSSKSHSEKMEGLLVSKFDAIKAIAWAIRPKSKDTRWQEQNDATPTYFMISANKDLGFIDTSFLKKYVEKFEEYTKDCNSPTSTIANLSQPLTLLSLQNDADNVQDEEIYSNEIVQPPAPSILTRITNFLLGTDEDDEKTYEPSADDNAPKPTPFEQARMRQIPENNYAEWNQAVTRNAIGTTNETVYINPEFLQDNAPTPISNNAPNAIGTTNETVYVNPEFLQDMEIDDEKTPISPTENNEIQSNDESEDEKTEESANSEDEERKENNALAPNNANNVVTEQNDESEEESNIEVIVQLDPVTYRPTNRYQCNSKDGKRRAFRCAALKAARRLKGAKPLPIYLQAKKSPTNEDEMITVQKWIGRKLSMKETKALKAKRAKNRKSKGLPPAKKEQHKIALDDDRFDKYTNKSPSSTKNDGNITIEKYRINSKSFICLEYRGRILSAKYLEIVRNSAEVEVAFVEEFCIPCRAR